MAPFYQAPFEEKNRHYFDFQRRSGQLPMQKEVCLLNFWKLILELCILIALFGLFKRVNI